MQGGFQTGSSDRVVVDHHAATRRDGEDIRAHRVELSWLFPRHNGPYPTPGQITWREAMRLGAKRVPIDPRDVAHHRAVTGWSLGVDRPGKKKANSDDPEQHTVPHARYCRRDSARP